MTSKSSLLSFTPLSVRNFVICLMKEERVKTKEQELLLTQAGRAAKTPRAVFPRVVPLVNYLSTHLLCFWGFVFLVFS